MRQGNRAKTKCPECVKTISFIISFYIIYYAWKIPWGHFFCNIYLILFYKTQYKMLDTFLLGT